MILLIIANYLELLLIVSYLNYRSLSHLNTDDEAGFDKRMESSHKYD